MNDNSQHHKFVVNFNSNFGVNTEYSKLDLVRPTLSEQ